MARWTRFTPLVCGLYIVLVLLPVFALLGPPELLGHRGMVTVLAASEKSRADEMRNWIAQAVDISLVVGNGRTARRRQTVIIAIITA
ncbi:MAG: hypothetical protein QOE59_1681, partial [Actinomycetota bacterium]|nr:hypothetical protein [Actinomycetota bacterium]